MVPAHNDKVGDAREREPWRAAEVAEHVLKQVADDGPFRAAVRQLLPSVGGQT